MNIVASIKYSNILKNSSSKIDYYSYTNRCTPFKKNDMLKIIVYSEFPNESPESNEHENRISDFKKAVKDVLTSCKGEVQFDYISTYKQFETKKIELNQTKLTKEQVKKIEQIIPNCWI